MHYALEDVTASAVYGAMIGLGVYLNGQRLDDPDALVAALAAGLFTAAVVLMVRIPLLARRRDEADERARVLRRIPAAEVAARPDLTEALRRAGIEDAVDLVVRRPRETIARTGGAESRGATPAR